MPTQSKTQALAFLSFLCVSFADAAISIHGSSTSYTETGGNWLSMATNDIDFSGGLGTDGWFFFGDFDGSQGSIAFDNVQSLPSYVSSITQGANYTSGAGEYSSYGMIDDPNTLDGSDVLAAFGHSTNGLAGTDNEILTFTVSGLAVDAVVRVGILAGIESNSDGRWDPTSITLSDGVNTATVGAHGSSDLEVNPGGTNTGWAFFDIDADGTYAVSCTQRLNTQGAGIGGLTFDSFDGSHDTLLNGHSIGIDFTDANGLAPVVGSNFNNYSDVTIANGATESFAGLLIDTLGDELTNVGFSVTNNSGQATARADVSGLEGSGQMSDESIYGDSIISNNTAGNPLAVDGNLVLTFTGLDDSLSYKLTGGYDQNNNNFNATWEADGKSFTTDNGATGFDTLSGLSTDGSGNLVITVTRSLHVTIAGLTLEASDLTNPDGSLNFPAALSEGGYEFPDALPGLTFSGMSALETLPGDPDKLFVVEDRGIVWMIPDVNAATPTKVQVLDRSSVNTNQTFNAMGGIAFHPDFANNGYIYVTYPSYSGQWTRVSRFTVTDPTNISLVDNNTEVVLIEENYHRSHGFNRLLFGPDGYLYIAVGDGKQDGDGADATLVSQTIDEGLWSSILRIDVDKDPSNYEPNLPNDGTSDLEPSFNLTIPLDGQGKAYYSIPADNPFVDQTAADGSGVSSAYGRATETAHVRTEMYAIGFRNPWKIGFVPDALVPGGATLWAIDVANAGPEKYCIVPKGGNVGWRIFEGTDATDPPFQTDYNFPPPAGVDYVQPVVQYDVTDSNSGSNNKSIIGGDFYLSSEIPALNGAYIMCDFNRGDIWAFHRTDHSDFQYAQRVDIGGGLYDMDSTGMVTETIGGVFDFDSYNVSSIEKLGNQAGIVSMIAHPTTGEVLMADYFTGTIRTISYSTNDSEAGIPLTLSATGAFTDVQNFAVNDAMHPYDVNLSFWSDNAIKSRYFNMVDTTGPMTYSLNEPWGFPAGSIWMKHFEMDLDLDNPGTDIKRIETRFLVKTEGDYYALTYQWNELETEATLVPDEGVDLGLEITDPGGATRIQQWRIPSRGECVACHTPDNGAVLGFSTRQLNHDGTLEEISGNFLTLLHNAGYLSDPGVDPATLPKYYELDEAAIDLEERVRSYLAVNCSYCHYDGNNAVPGSWSGEPALSIEATNLLHGEAIGAQVIDETDRHIIPGDTANSIILNRAAAANGYLRMPPLATSVIDQEGVALLTDWILNYANAAPTISAPVSTLTIAENSAASSSVGSPDANDPDAPLVDRGTLTYSIIAGNEDGLFTIDANTGEISLSLTAPDYEAGNTSHSLTIQVTDGFPANPGSASAAIPIEVSDVPNDDSQGDGVADEWALAKLGSSAINALGDSDHDGTVELFEYWGDTNPLDGSERFVLEGAAPLPIDGYYFEWIIRDSLTADVDYIVEGSTSLVSGFAPLTLNVDYTIESSDPVVEKPGLSRVRIKVTTASPEYFLRISTP
ncbi:MAG: PQQ-dependent sugar dehydrogenase [Opitutaceae bacterium]